jgi:hypothetical protein
MSDDVDPDHGSSVAEKLRKGSIVDLLKTFTVTNHTTIGNSDPHCGSGTGSGSGSGSGTGTGSGSGSGGTGNA